MNGEPLEGARKAGMGDLRWCLELDLGDLFDDCFGWLMALSWKMASF